MPSRSIAGDVPLREENENGVMQALWNSLDSTLKAAVIAAVGTGLATIFGFGGVIITIIAQGKQSRRAVEENERRRLKASMYEDALSVCRVMVDSAIELSNDLRMMTMQITIASQAAENALSYLPAARYPALAASYARFADAAIKTIILIENRRIIDPRLIVFRTAISTVLHNTRQLMYSDFPIIVIPSIPMDNPAGGTFPYTPPLPDNIQIIAQLSEKFLDALGDAVAYSEDLLVELQNHLLGDLFRNKVLPRRPLDPSKRAITLQNAVELEQWFRSSTPWGKNVSEVEADTIARFSKTNASGDEP